MGHETIFPIFLKATCFPTGPLRKNRVSKYPDGKMRKMEVSGGIQKTGYFLGLILAPFGSEILSQSSADPLPLGSDQTVGYHRLLLNRRHCHFTPAA